MTFETVHVDLPGRAYDILIGAGLLREAGQHIAPFLRRKRVAIITDETVAGLHLATLQASLDAAGIAHSALALPPGEATKGWAQFSRTVEWILTEKIERSDLVIALGGGVIGDLVGFAAAVVRRGVRFVQIPTTLLAQVDSSVGGKTGINTAQGKNLVGAFHQPTLVLADTGLLATLPPRDFLAGYGEVVKYGLLGDAAFFEWLEVNGPAMAEGDIDKRNLAVRRSCEMKAEIVMRDETEQGDRALLNLGHTFGHALEAEARFDGSVLHGEAVAVGLGLAASLSARLGHCSQEWPSRVISHLTACGLPARITDLPRRFTVEALLGRMAKDKKNRDGKMRFVLLRAPGDCFTSADVPAEAVEKLLRDEGAA